MSNFFPEEIRTESVSRYTKLGQGVTRIRMIGEPIFYNETWVENNDGSRSPRRFGLNEEIPMDECGPDGVKQVMSIVVYNYNEKMVQVFSISQKQILKPLKAYSENPKYGDPTGYDINIEKTGEKLQTRYNVIADPKEDISDEIVAAMEKVVVDLDKLLVNENPFSN